MSVMFRVPKCLWLGGVLTFSVAVMGQNLVVPQGGEFSLLGGLPGDQVRPSISLSSSAGCIAWQDNVIDKLGAGLGGALLHPSSFAASSIFRVNKVATGDQIKPKVSASGQRQHPLCLGEQRRRHTRHLRPLGQWNHPRRRRRRQNRRRCCRRGRRQDRRCRRNSRRRRCRRCQDRRRHWHQDRCRHCRRGCRQRNQDCRRRRRSSSHRRKNRRSRRCHHLRHQLLHHRHTGQHLHHRPASRSGCRGVARRQRDHRLVQLRRGREHVGSARRKYKSTGAPATPKEFLVNQYTRYNQRNPAVATLANGNYVITWTSEQERRFNSIDVYARIFTVDGVPVTDEIPVNSTANTCATPAIAPLADGGFTVVWAQKDLTVLTNSWDVWGRAFSAAGKPDAADFRINTYFPGDQFLPKIAAGPSGSLVVWTSLHQDGSREGVFGRFLSGGTQLSGDEFQVNTTWISQQIHPTVAWNGVDRFLVVWTSFVGSTGFDLYGQAYGLK